MSIISNTHQFTPLTKTSTALSGQRLVRVIAKADRNGKYPSAHLTESLCVSVPRIGMDDIAECIERFIPHLISLCEGVQDKIAREYRIESGRNEIQGELLSVDAILGYLEADAAGNRVSKEYLQEWFMDGYADIARVWIQSVSNGLCDELVDKKITVLGDMFAGYSSHKYSPNIPSLRAILRFVDHCVALDAADSRMVAMRDKAQATLTKKESELSTDALGF